jgi:hypothetical protein
VKYFTAVFAVSDKAAFQEYAKKITAAMCGESEIPGATVTGAGWEDSMTERDNMAAFLEENGYDSEEVGRGE